MTSVPGSARTPSSLSKTAWALLGAGLALREALAGWTGHPYDLEVWIRTGHAVAQGSNPYAQFWPAVPGVSFAFPSTALPSASYLPFWPLVFGATYRFWQFAGDGNRFFLYFLLKQGPIAGDLLTAGLLYRLVLEARADERLARRALAFWALFPYAILISSVWGQLDAVTTAVVLATIGVAGRRPVRRGLLYGFGIFAKWITAIFLPLELFRQRGVRRLFPVLSVGLAAGATVGVFVALGWPFGGLVSGGTSQTHGGGMGMNLAFVLGYGPIGVVLAGIPYVLTAAGWAWIPAVIVAGWVACRWVGPDLGLEQELRAVTFVTAVFCLTRWGLYEQYLLYLFAPLLVDAVAFHPGRRPLYVLLGVLAQVDLLVNNNLGVWFAAPSAPWTWVVSSAVDAGSPWGVLRTDALLVLSVLVTVTLVQLVWTLGRNDQHPTPWVWLWRSSRIPSQVADPTA